MNQLLQLLTNKRYTSSRVLRTLIHILVNDTSGSRDYEEISYLRLLGTNTKGRQILKELKKNTHLPIITGYSGFSHPHLDLEMSATKVYHLSTPLAQREKEIQKEYTNPPIIFK